MFQNLLFIKTASGPDLPTVHSSLTPDLDYFIRLFYSLSEATQGILEEKDHPQVIKHNPMFVYFRLEYLEDLGLLYK